MSAEHGETGNGGESGSAKPSLRPYAFIATFGAVSMLMDVVYQAALSVQGPLLASLGATALVVGVVSGLGEATALVGRLLSGPLADRTGRYWLLAILGYAATAVAVPAMGFIGSLAGVSALVVFERFGKSLRTPSRDAMLSHAASAVGTGKGFALHEVLDQIGAFAGPLATSALLSATAGDYRVALGVMIVPGLAAVVVLLCLKRRVPDPARYEEASEGVADAGASSPSSSAVVSGDARRSEAALDGAGRRGDVPATARALPPEFWRYTLTCGIVLAGVATFGVQSYHMVSSGLLPDAGVPLLYALAMAVDAVFAWLTGAAFDRKGPRVLLALPIVCAVIPVFAYAGSVWMVVVGVVLWGAALGIQESTMRAAVAGMVPPGRRATAYGLFSVAIGVGGLVGGVVAGALYDVSVFALMVYAVVVEAIAFALLWKTVRR